MADWLLLRLPADRADPVGWVVADARGALLTAPSMATGAPLVTAAQGRRVALLVPGSDVLQLQANLPHANEARLQQLAPFALEDQLSEDIESLHFAVGSRPDKGAPTPVMVVSRALLDEWLARARELELQPEAIFADSDLIPEVPGHVTAVLDVSTLTLRREGHPPLVLPVEDPALALEMLLGPDADLSTVHVSLLATPLAWQRHSAGFEALRSRIASMKIQLATGGMMALLAPGIAQRGRTNLLQGTYRAKQDHSATLRRWRLVAALAAALLVLHAAGNVWQLTRLRSSEKQLDAAISQVAAPLLPGESTSGNVRRRIEQRLGTAGAGRQEGELLHLLSAVAAAHDNVPVTKIQSMAFKPGNLDLRVTGPDAQSLEQLSQALRAGGYSAEVNSGSPSGDSFEGRVIMRGPGS